MIEKVLLERMFESFREEMEQLPPPPEGCYYTPKITGIRVDGAGRVTCEAVIICEPINKQN